jgi:hypothetical protein
MMEFAQQTRALPRTVARAIELFNKVADADRHNLTCHFRDGKAHVERRDGKPFRTKKSVAAADAELRAAREKVARVRDAASAPLVAFHEKLRRIRENTAREWENG